MCLGDKCNSGSCGLESLDWNQYGNSKSVYEKQTSVMEKPNMYQNCNYQGGSQ